MAVNNIRSNDLVIAILRMISWLETANFQRISIASGYPKKVQVKVDEGSLHGCAEELLPAILPTDCQWFAATRSFRIHW